MFIFPALDFGRTFPSSFTFAHHRFGKERNQQKNGEFISQQVRPELVKSYKVPIPSEAGSNFSKGYCTDHQRNYRILECAEQALFKKLPKIAKVLEEKFNFLHRKENLINQFLYQWMIKQVHDEGINIRYLGLLRKHTKQGGKFSCLLLTEMVFFFFFFFFYFFF